MEVKAQLSFMRSAPRKMILLADEIRGKNINFALTYLRFSPRKKAAMALHKLLKSAVANADQKGKGAIDVDNLFVKTVLVCQGPTLKRFRPRAKGSAFGIKKRTSHIKVTLAEKV
ncbi:MAG: 50S ribosomal protein L22 [Bacteriovoracia bacterium]